MVIEASPVGIEVITIQVGKDEREERLDLLGRTFSATPDARAPRPRQGARDKASCVTTPTSCASASSPATGVSSAPPTPSLCSNLSTPLKKSGQVALPSTAARFTVECLLELANLLRCLDERAKAGREAPTPKTQD